MNIVLPTAERLMC